jgi:hypothetical protein
MVDDLGTVYKIYCRDSGIRECYIGSTKNMGNRILKHHNYNYGLKENSKLYTFIKENGGWGNWIIEEMESFAFNNIKELREKEQEYINVLKPALNIATAHKETKDKVYEYNEKYFKESTTSRRVMGKTLEWGETGAITVSIPKRSA